MDVFDPDEAGSNACSLHLQLLADLVVPGKACLRIPGEAQGRREPSKIMSPVGHLQNLMRSCVQDTGRGAGAFRSS